MTPRAASAAQPIPATMGPRQFRVVKLGGSLLDCPDLPRLWRNWRAAQPPAVDVLIAGGGAFADVVRRADATHRLGDQAAHVLAIQSLSLTARLLANLLPEARWAGRLTEAAVAAPEGPAAPVVLDLGACWQDPDSRPALATLPASWDVTSDSLAAAVACWLGAVELVLLKSASPPTLDLAELAATGYVDAYFPQATAGLSVRLVNLRSVALP
ncbi:MAG TPA: hypothetical protein VGG30_07650 [Pirellulales bacterium]